MKRIFFTAACLTLLLGSCQKNENENAPKQQEIAVDMSDFYVYTSEESTVKSAAEEHVHSAKCGSMQVLNRQLKENPGLENRMYAIEKHTRQLIAAKSTGSTNKGKPGGGETTPATPYQGSITIPVIVNILEDANHPVTQAHIDSQIDILNDDYNDLNPATGAVPSEFNNDVANVDITFVLAGVNRKTSSKTSWGTNDAMKLSSQGGIDATDPSFYLNFWVCEIGGGILGYAQFPGGALATDGVVIGSDYFGRNTSGGQYGYGRTATHEVGHWLNLRHIWGDGRCSQDDFVTDTPSSDRANYGCPSYPTVHCKSNDQTMNYMDYVDDQCMYMFTNGQNDRIRAIFAAGGERESFVQ
ncbi:zinc metalloprotease [Labilibaculum sp.]|uniref:zinc metalloprotease n=1 Tax=Labilibaculum sp. TaxID=2060723 RepID=UPI002AA5FD76|nr:zinc metalloprotease [Labilibaculum sp.]MBN2598436.1 zinc metalloprotease [Marinifilaceae bacterium]